MTAISLPEKKPLPRSSITMDATSRRGSYMVYELSILAAPPAAARASRPLRLVNAP
jgi:hypothetical protein